MFDLTVPLMLSRYEGTAVLSVDESSDSWLVFLCKGVHVIDLLIRWKEEAKAIVARERKKAVLPMQIRRDLQNRIGCTRGVACVRESDQLYFFDVGEIHGSFGVSPCTWWKFINLSKKTSKDFIGPVHDSSFESWVARMDAAIYACRCIAETNIFYRNIRKENVKIVSNELSKIAGGKVLLSKFPRDYMKKLMLIRRSASGDNGFEVGWEAGNNEFDGIQILGGRDVRALKWWINMQLACNRFVAFLCPCDLEDENVALYLINRDDNVPFSVRQALSESRINSKSLDHVIISFSNECPGLSHLMGKCFIDKAEFCELSNHISHVALGIIRESAWAEFSICE